MTTSRLHARPHVSPGMHLRMQCVMHCCTRQTGRHGRLTSVRRSTPPALRTPPNFASRWSLDVHIAHENDECHARRRRTGTLGIYYSQTREYDRNEVLTA